MQQIDPQSSPPLTGIKVVDVSRVLAGPYASMLLGDLGADVIKVERPDGGDQTRSWGPPFLKGESTYYLSVNRNKRSITLNLKTPQGREILEKLTTESDVVIQNFRPAAVHKLGLEYEHLRSLNSKLIYCSITGYGETSSWKDRPAYDIALQAESGLMSITGDENGSPVRVGIAVIDIVTAHHAVEGIMAALIARQRTGEGQKLDLSMLDCGVAFMTYMANHYLATGESPQRMGSRHPSIAPYQAFATKDAWIIIAGGSQEIWARLCRALNEPALKEDSRFIDNAKRVENRVELERILGDIFRQRSTKDWLNLLQAHEVPATSVNDLHSVFGLKPLQERNMVQEIHHPKIGMLSLLGSPIKLQTTPASVRLPPPLLGEHTDEVLQHLGYSTDQISAFREQQVI